MARGGRKSCDEALILSLACGASVEQAARKANVSSRTLHRRLKEPEFRAQLQAARNELVERSSAILTAAAMEAVKTLVTLQHPATPAAVRLGAARAVLEVGMRMRESCELTERITALEAQLAGR